MTKLEAFKKFIGTIPSIKEDVLSGRYTWQQLYEIYDMYGEEDKFWQPYKKDKSTKDFSFLSEMVKSIDLEAVASGLQGLEKILGMVSGFVVKDNQEEQQNQQPPKYRWYDE